MGPIDRASTSVPSAAFLAPELTVVIPTFNGQANISILVGRLQAALAGNEWEVIFVDDDSPDGTAAQSVNWMGVCVVSGGWGGADFRVACIEGMLASNARYVATMDADLQHDEKLLGEMLRRLPLALNSSPPRHLPPLSQ